MIITKLELVQFRNHTKHIFEFSAKSTLIHGNNGAGKTNVLEAIYMLSIGKSFRAPTEKDVINIESNFARVIGYFSDMTKLEIGVERTENGRVRKVFKKNGVVRKAKDFVGVFKSVLFNPEDIRLVIGSPTRRRDYLDGFLSQIYPEYYRSLNKYERVLKHRNKLLELSRGQFVNNLYDSQLEVWDRQLVELGITVQEYRRRFFVFAEENLPGISRDLFGENYLLKLDYRQSHINETTLEGHRRKDLVTGHTSVGPHRDDFDFIIIVNTSRTFDLRSYGSRGQQRMAVLALKLLEMLYIEEKSAEKPVLLLDDIFSELDDHFRKSISEVMGKYQSIVSSAEKVELEFEKEIDL